jgi:hypothetical protein
MDKIDLELIRQMSKQFNIFLKSLMSLATTSCST